MKNAGKVKSARNHLLTRLLTTEPVAPRSGEISHYTRAVNVCVQRQNLVWGGAGGAWGKVCVGEFINIGGFCLNTGSVLTTTDRVGHLPEGGWD